MSAPTPPTTSDVTADATRVAVAATAEEPTQPQDESGVMPVPTTPQRTTPTEPANESGPVITKVHPSLEEVTEMIRRVMTIQGEQNQTQQLQIQEANMKMLKDLMELKGMRTPEKEWSTEYKPPRQHVNRIEAKSFSRMNQFVGGETD